jgi:hypothetical protein
VPDGDDLKSTKRRFCTAVRPLAIICASILALGIASCFAALKWTGTRAQAKALQAAQAVRVGMPLNDALAVARALGGVVAVQPALADEKPKRVIVSFPRLDGEYIVMFCLDPEERVAEVVPPAEYAEGCFVNARNPSTGDRKVP